MERRLMVTAVLITKEKEYPKEVLDSLPKFNELIIEKECPSIYRRYELAAKAKNDLIYVQDDDCIVDVWELLSFYNGRITNFITPQHKKYYEGMGITLVGWGTFFQRRMVDFAPYLEKYPIDDVFLTQTDRVFTYLNQPHNSIITDVKHLSTAVGPGRMSTSPGHWEYLAEIRERLYNIKRNI